MTHLRIGTRGSDLARWQANWICERLRELHSAISLELVTIKTHGDLAADESFGPSWPAGAFVSAVEQALLDRRVDLAVHSYKDLPTASTAGLSISAIPERELVHDVLLTRGPARLDRLPDGARIGTSSPRRAAQMLRVGNFEIIPLRGNVPTRIAKLKRDGLYGIVLAAAGLKRLGIDHPHTIDLPTDRFVPAPGQGALAVQAREASEAAELVTTLDHLATRQAVTAERSLLKEISAGCHTPVGALATVGTGVSLRAQLFGDDHSQLVEGEHAGADPESVGVQLARRLLAELRG